jgi:hypothetical protein
MIRANITGADDADVTSDEGTPGEAEQSSLCPADGTAFIGPEPSYVLATAIAARRNPDIECERELLISLRPP